MDGLFDLSGGLVDIWELEIYIYICTYFTCINVFLYVSDITNVS